MKKLMKRGLILILVLAIGGFFMGCPENNGDDPFIPDEYHGIYLGYDNREDTGNFEYVELFKNKVEFGSENVKFSEMKNIEDVFTKAYTVDNNGIIEVWGTRGLDPIPTFLGKFIDNTGAANTNIFLDVYRNYAHPEDSYYIKQ